MTEKKCNSYIKLKYIKKCFENNKSCFENSQIHPIGVLKHRRCFRTHKVGCVTFSDAAIVAAGR